MGEQRITNAKSAYVAIHKCACEWLNDWIDGGLDGEKDFPDMLALAEFIEKVEARISKALLPQEAE